MATLSRLARAKRELQPLEQGDLDSLCGLYAIINAVRLVVYPDHILTPGILGCLFERGLSTLSHKRKLKQTVTHGIDNALWLLMCQAVIAKAETLVERRIAIRPLVDEDRRWRTRDVVGSIKRAVNHDRPVLICLEGRLDHCSVVVGSSTTRLYLFDSAGSRWISIASLAAGDRQLNRPHFVAREGAVVIECRPSKSFRYTCGMGASPFHVFGTMSGTGHFTAGMRIRANDRHWDLPGALPADRLP